MGDPILRVSALTKTYRVYSRPSHRVGELLFGWHRSWHNEIRALENVSFEVPRGSVFGVIGQNGSGKSTLLATLAGVRLPTSGTVEAGGTISLLQLGTGFNPEFTGRENVRMVATLSGLSRGEIEHRMPEILKFADIGEFVDHPVKLYSSGMYMRLAFAIAIHGDQDVLVVDEALAVGDMQFRHRCLDRIQTLRSRGLTLIYASHEIESVRALSDSVLLLDRGRTVDLGDPDRVCNRYYQLVAERELSAEPSAAVAERSENGAAELVKPRITRFWVDPGLEARARESRYGSGEARIRGVQLLDESDRPIHSVAFDQRVTFRVSVECLEEFPSVGRVGIAIRDRNGQSLTGANTHGAGVAFGPRKAGDRVTVDFQMRLPLQGFSYIVRASVSRDPARPLVADRIDDALEFHVGLPPEPLRMYWPIYLNPEVSVWPPAPISEAARNGALEREAPANASLQRGVPPV